MSTSRSEYYNLKRKRNLYNPDSVNPFKLSRSKVDLFMECPRCFYLDRRLGVARPPGFPFSLNNAVDQLLKKEFDSYREKGQNHPLQIEYGIDAFPAKHVDLENWRNNFKGIQFFHEPTNFTLFGAIDDLWINAEDEYIVVDYKSTSRDEKIVVLDKDWHDSYKRQIEFYQWLLRKNDFLVSDDTYFVYCNALKSRDSFEKKLDFDVTLILHIGNDDWVESVIEKVYQCLRANDPPELNISCDYCRYLKMVELEDI